MISTAMKGTAAKKEAVIQWPKIFPEQVTKTYNSSLVFMKQLTMAAVSTITYVKSVLPETCYSVENVGGVEVRLLKSSSDDLLGNFLYRALTQAFEAFDKKYLEQLIMCFYDGVCKPENLTQFFIFDYEYTDDGGVALSMTSKGNAKDSFKYDMNKTKKYTVTMIKNCVVMAASSNVDVQQLDVSIRLYYNDKAPEGYQAPGFSAASHVEDPLETISTGSRLGEVVTPYHQLRVASYFKEKNDEASHEAVASLNTPSMTLSQTQADARSGSSTDTTTAVGASAKAAWNCVCLLNLDLDWPTLTCYYCSSVQHAACYGVLARDVGRVQRHCCVQCAAGHRTRATDPRLLAEPAKQVTLAIYRCALAWCMSLHSVGEEQLREKFAMKTTSVMKLFKLLRNTGIVNDVDGDGPKPINRAVLNVHIKKYFRTFDDLADRLLEETFSSQEMQEDPIAQVLGPMKQVSLKNAFITGRVINPSDNNNNDDPILNQYKQAMQSLDTTDIDLPLSGSHNPVKDLLNVGKKRKNDKSGDVVAPKRAKAVSKK